MLFIFSKTSSSQRVLGLPIGLLHMGFHLVIFCTLLSSAMRSTWPNQFKLCFSTATIMTQMHLNIALICTLPLLPFLLIRCGISTPHHHCFEESEFFTNLTTGLNYFIHFHYYFIQYPKKKITASRHIFIQNSSRGSFKAVNFPPFST